MASRLTTADWPARIDSAEASRRQLSCSSTATEVQLVDSKINPYLVSSEGAFLAGNEEVDLNAPSVPGAPDSSIAARKSGVELLPGEYRDERCSDTEMAALGVRVSAPVTSGIA